MARPTQKPCARRRHTVNSSVSRTRQIFHVMVFFVTLALVTNSLIGERGLFASLAARQQYRRLVGHIQALKHENTELRAKAHRLKVDPRAVEEIARQELDLIMPGEIMFLFHDTPAVRAHIKTRRPGPSASRSKLSQYPPLH